MELQGEWLTPPVPFYDSWTGSTWPTSKMGFLSITQRETPVSSRNDACQLHKHRVRQCEHRMNGSQLHKHTARPLA